MNKCWLFSVRSCGLHMRAISQEILNIFILDMSLKITNIGLQPHLSGANELSHSGLTIMVSQFMVIIIWNNGFLPGPLLTKRTDVLRQDLVKSRLLKPQESSLGFSNHSKLWQAPLQPHCQYACQISEWYNHYGIQSRSFETSRDLAVRLLTAFLSGRLKGPICLGSSKDIDEWWFHDYTLSVMMKVLAQTSKASFLLSITANFNKLSGLRNMKSLQIDTFNLSTAENGIISVLGELGQYNGCRYPNSLHCQVIRIHNIDCVTFYISGSLSSMRKISTTCAIRI